MTRDELLAKLNDSHNQLEAALRGLSDDQLTSQPVLGEWTIKDVLAHVTAWEVEAVTLLGKLERGQKVGPLPWSEAEVQKLNEKWYKDYARRPLDRVLADWRGVRTQTMRRVSALTEAALQEKRPALGNLTLEEIIRVESFEHEAEHAAHILEWKRQPGPG